MQLLRSFCGSWACGPLCVAVVVGLLFSNGCSLLLDSNATQCHTDLECGAFGQAVCDTSGGVCAPGSLSVDAGAESAARGQGSDAAVPGQDSAPCQGPNGCFACAPASDHQFLSACSDSVCIPFDNRSRLKNLADDGSLKPLP